MTKSTYCDFRDFLQKWEIKADPYGFVEKRDIYWQET